MQWNVHIRSLGRRPFHNGSLGESKLLTISLERPRNIYMIAPILWLGSMKNDIDYYKGNTCVDEEINT